MFVLPIRGVGLVTCRARIAEALQPGRQGVRGPVANDGCPGADLPFRHQSARHVRVDLGERFNHVPGRRGEEENPQIHRIGECSAEQELATRHGFARVLDVRTAELRPAFKDVRHVCIEEEKVHGRRSPRTGCE